MKKHYIFDLDGTIADSMVYWYSSFTPEDLENDDRMVVRRGMKSDTSRIP